MRVGERVVQGEVRPAPNMKNTRDQGRRRMIGQTYDDRAVG